MTLAESESARVRQMGTIDALIRERDALAAECKAMRRMIRNGDGGVSISGIRTDWLSYEEAVKHTNAIPGLRARLEGT